MSDVNRISNASLQNLLNQQMFKLQADLAESQIAVTSQKRSQQYSGYSGDAGRLIALEVNAIERQRFIDNNTTADIKLGAIELGLDAIEGVVREFRNQLSDFAQNDRTNEDQISTLQKFAYQALRDIQGYLNTDADGQYIFAGSRTTIQPVDLDLGTNLGEFQTKWDGYSTTYPTTRDAHLSQFELDNGGATWLQWDADGGTGGQNARITSSVAGQFTDVQVGQKIVVENGSNAGTYTVAEVGALYLDVLQEWIPATAAAETPQLTFDNGEVLDSPSYGTLTFTSPGTITATTANAFSDLGNLPLTVSVSGGTYDNESFTITANDGTNLTIANSVVTDVAADEIGTIRAVNYYSGDQTTTTHRLDSTRSFEYELNATDAAFEKAIRGLAIIAQGDYGTEGGLNNNTSRVDDALYLLTSALEFPVSGTAPYGTEDTSSLDQVAFDNGFKQLSVFETNERLTQFVGFFEANIADIENTNLLEAVTLLQDQSRALEASYQVIARTQQLGLSNFL